MFLNPEPDFTLLIPTMNRPAEFAMLCRYLVRHRARFDIVALDASDLGVQKQNAAQLSALPLKAKHYAFSAGTPLFETVCAGLAEIKTPYSALIPDDDIPLPDGLAHALGFLRRHSDYVAAQGYHLSFLPHQNGIRLIDIPEWTPSIDQEQPLARLFHYARRYQPACFAVYRTEVLARSHAAPLGLDNRGLTEHMQAFIAVREGKLARLPVIHRLRREDQSIVPRVQLHIFYQFIDSPEQLGREFPAYRERLVDAFLPTCDGRLGRQEVARVIDLIYGHYFDRHFDPAWTEVVIKKILGLISPKDLAHEENSRLPAAMRPPLVDAAQDVASGDGRMSRFWVESGVLKDLENPEISLAMGDIGDAIADAAEYY